MSVKREPYPLQWPEGWSRHKGFRYGRGTSRHEAKFDAMFARDRDAVIRQLRMRGSNIVITSDLPTRSDGVPYANASCNDPGIAVYWVEKGRERVIACDRWKSVSLNMRAIDLSLEALRGLDRWGATDMVERAFAGFAALPSGSGAEYVAPPPPPQKRPWRDVLGETFAPWPELDADELLVLAKSRYRKLVQVHHPDHGGAADRAAELNVAIDEATRELAPS